MKVIQSHTVVPRTQRDSPRGEQAPFPGALHSALGKCHANASSWLSCLSFHPHPPPRTVGEAVVEHCWLFGGVNIAFFSSLIIYITREENI